jgi:hypothetical protein
MNRQHARYLAPAMPDNFAAKQQQDARLAQHRGEQNRQKNQNNRLQRQEPPAAISESVDRPSPSLSLRRVGPGQGPA